MHPDWRIGLEIEPETWDTVRVQTPEAYQHFKEVATSQQVEFTNPTYAQPYCYNISGESIIRQFQYGIAKIMHIFQRWISSLIPWRNLVSQAVCHKFLNYSVLNMLY